MYTLKAVQLMQVIGIKERQTNPGKLTKAFQDNDYLLITKHGQPLGLALPFSKGIMEQGLLPWFARFPKWGFEFGATQQSSR